MAKYPNCKLKLQGTDGNAPDILKRAVDVLRKAGVSETEIDEFHHAVFSGSLMTVLMEWFDVD